MGFGLCLLLFLLEAGLGADELNGMLIYACILCAAISFSAVLIGFRASDAFSDFRGF